MPRSDGVAPQSRALTPAAKQTGLGGESVGAVDARRLAQDLRVANRPPMPAPTGLRARLPSGPEALLRFLGSALTYWNGNCAELRDCSRLKVGRPLRKCHRQGKPGPLP
jgi:hypothetical protein